MLLVVRCVEAANASNAHRKLTLHNRNCKRTTKEMYIKTQLFILIRRLVIVQTEYDLTQYKLFSKLR